MYKHLHFNVKMILRRLVCRVVFSSFSSFCFFKRIKTKNVKYTLANSC